MIKEKDYPYFCQPEGKEKFEQFVKDFHIDKEGKIPRHIRYFYFRDEEPDSYLQDRGMMGVCDHPSVWAFGGTRYVVFQSYDSLEQILTALQENPKFISNCMEYNHAVDIYLDGRYNWHRNNNIFILVTLDMYSDPKYLGTGWYSVNIHNKDGTIKKVLYKKELIMKEEDK